MSQGEVREVVESLDGKVWGDVNLAREYVSEEHQPSAISAGTGITWEALAGTDPVGIQLRSGHERCATTQ